MSIDAGAQVAIILLAFGPCVVVVYDWDRLRTLGRAPRTRETLPDVDPKKQCFLLLLLLLFYCFFNLEMIKKIKKRTIKKIKK